MAIPSPAIKTLGRVEYQPTWDAMREFTATRGPDTADEIWLLEHPPVYTQGLAGKPEHLLNPAGIPVVQTDRGGQITYHGPGQLVAYPLLDLKRLGIGIRSLVHGIEQAVIDYLSDLGVAGERRDKAPGVYVDGAKIASIGLKIRRGCTYHGLAFNISMDLSPFAGINPCGFAGLPMTRLSDREPEASVTSAGLEVSIKLQQGLGYDRLDTSRRMPAALETQSIDD